MAKKCTYEGCENNVWSRKTMRCKMHQIQKTAANKKTANNLKRTPLKPISDKRKKQQAAYKVLRDDYLKRHKVCEICGKPNPNDIHHKGGRMEDKLNDFTNVMALCRDCHHRIHHVSPKWARNNGYLE